MAKVHAEIAINGIVQGVGFRPFIHRRVREFGLFGKIRNTSFGVCINLEGERERIDAFLKNIELSAPKLSVIHNIEVSFSDTLFGYSSFKIEESECGERKTLVSPDVAVCDDCLSEMFDKENRRYRYPFINCTNCGPRFTIVRDIPYDRKNTTMAPFSMCAPCEAEYTDIEDRRYHAEPTACKTCGPALSFVTSDGKESDDPIAATKEALLRGGIVAIKGLGGVHLACRADDESAIVRLRARKRRDEKPFAIMCRDIESAREFAYITDAEERLLKSPARPIVLLKKRKKGKSAISENGFVGIMLPYTPLHHLIFEGEISALVMTSANISELPIVYKDEEAVSKLSEVADAFLLNNREIFARCDDSLVWEFSGREYFARRSRGYVPNPVIVESAEKKILACGAEQKASFAISRGSEVFPSAHIGDLKNLETLSHYAEQIAHFRRIFDIEEELIVCDMHPDYMSGEYARARAEEKNIPCVAAYHHHAHMASCMADNGIDEKCIGITWDGTGYGRLGKIWGAEFLVGDFCEFQRRGTILDIPLPGGDRATYEIMRIGASLLEESGIFAKTIFGERGEKISKLLAADINCPRASSMGRLFDGVSAILGIRETVSYEGQGATLLEAAAEDGCDKVYPYSIYENDGCYVFDWRGMIREIVADKEKGVPVSEIAAAFINTLCSFALDMTKKISRDTSLSKVVLSGGSFQNMYMLKRMCDGLTQAGFEVYTHRQVSTNDEGIALGQIMIAERGGGENVSCSTT